MEGFRRVLNGEAGGLRLSPRDAEVPPAASGSSAEPSPDLLVGVDPICCVTRRPPAFRSRKTSAAPR